MNVSKECMYIVLLLRMVLVQAANDTKGTEFILAFMELATNTSDAEVYITTSNPSTVRVKVQTPAYKGVRISDSNFNIIHGQVKIVTISPWIRTNGTSKDSKGILVTATAEISVYGFNTAGQSSDAFLALPTDVLGKHYYAITYYPPSRQCQMLVAAVYNSTVVHITLGVALGNNSVYYNKRVYMAGDFMYIRLNRYDTFQVHSEGDLTGTYVTSDKAIAVFSGNKDTHVKYLNGSDHLCEQLMPVEAWGKSFMTLPLPHDYYVKFVANECNTNVNITLGGLASTLTLNKTGDIGQLNIQHRIVCSIVADKPISVVQISKGSYHGYRPMMSIIIPIEQFGSNTYTYSIPQTLIKRNYLVFFSKNSDINKIKFDGVSKQVNIFSVNMLYGGGYVSATIGSHSVELPSSTYAGYIWGSDDKQAYGMPVGMNVNYINPMVDEVDRVDDCSGGQWTIDGDNATTTSSTSTGESIPTTTRAQLTDTTLATATLAGPTPSPISPEDSTATTDNSYTTGFTSTTSIAGDPTSPSTTTDDYTPQSSETTTQCQCPPCRAPTNYTTEELKAKIEELKAQLLVPKNTTGSYIRARISAKDDRPSSQAIGYIGYILFAVLGVGLLVVDAGNLLRMFKTMKRNLLGK